ncbi:MAG: A/G-specific adenine glycosylase [Anaerolineales bacterium]
MADAPDRAAITAALLAWYRAERRDLPWRQTTDPYRIWLSEILLQQTRVASVIPYYRRLTERYPTIEALATAELDELLALWQGLGYYARARNLLRAAQVVCLKYSGQLPAEREALLSLPGIGEYTADAILSIAYGQPVAAIDGNVRRVLARLFDLPLDTRSPEAGRWFAETAHALLPPDAAGDYNQTMMDLGAMVCTPRHPACAACPLDAQCLALARGTIAERPVRQPRQPVAVHVFVAAYSEQDGRLLLVRRPPTGLLGGLWELPNWPVPPGEAPAGALESALAIQAPGAQVGGELALVRHGYTHFSVRMHVLRTELPGDSGAFDPAPMWDTASWLAREELGHYGLTGATVKALGHGS